MIKVVLFDLDGTLLPMEDLSVFINSYFGLLAKRLSNHGYDPKALIDAVWAGTRCMLKNDGKKTNEEVFWDKFAEIFGEEKRKDIGLFEKFYLEDFKNTKNTCGYNPLVAEVVAKIKEKGLKVAIATSPIFPAIATHQRVQWAGLNLDDFELVTTYENCTYGKPNIAYYQEIIDKLGVKPEECLMVGNDVSEDMVAQAMGMKVFLITDCLINKEEKDISVYPNGNYNDLLNYLNKEIF